MINLIPYRFVFSVQLRLNSYPAADAVLGRSKARSTDSFNVVNISPRETRRLHRLAAALLRNIAFRRYDENESATFSPVRHSACPTCRWKCLSVSNQRVVVLWTWATIDLGLDPNEAPSYADTYHSIYFPCCDERCLQVGPSVALLA